jgi:hypothetical protein
MTHSYSHIVSHVVLVLHDQAPELNLIKLIQTAEMLKPQTAAPDGTDNIDYSPQVVSIINRGMTHNDSYCL